MSDLPHADDRHGFLFHGGDPCLDFVNTVICSPKGGSVDLLDSAEALLSWCEASGVFDRKALTRFRAAWTAQDAAVSILPVARDFRARLARVVNHLTTGKPYVAAAARTLELYLEPVALRRRVIVDQGRLRTVLEPEASTSAEAEFCATLATSAFDLFANADPRQIRKCANPGCVLIFHDTTKNHRRQWCSMEACGNRAKVSRFRAQERTRTWETAPNQAP